MRLRVVFRLDLDLEALPDPKRSFVGNKIPKGDSETINWSDLSMNTKPKEDELNSHEDS